LWDIIYTIVPKVSNGPGIASSVGAKPSKFGVGDSATNSDSRMLFTLILKDLIYTPKASQNELPLKKDEEPSLEYPY